MTPPTVWTASWWTMPSCGRADVDALQLVLGRNLALDELGRSFLAISRNSFATSLRRSWSIWMICSSISDDLAFRPGRLPRSTARARLRAAPHRVRAPSCVDRHQFCVPQARARLPARPGSARSRGAWPACCSVSPADLLVKLGDPFAQLRLLAGSRLRRNRTAIASPSIDAATPASLRRAGRTSGKRSSALPSRSAS